jgi:hypothetical protein
MHENFFYGNTGRKRPLRELRCGWEDNIIVGLKEVGFESVYCIHLAEARDG